MITRTGFPDWKLSISRIIGEEKREAAQGPMWETIDFGTDLMEHPKNDEGQLREKAIQDGLETLKDALDRWVCE